MDLLWINYSRPRSAWYELASSDRTSLQKKWAEIRNASEEAGAKQIGEFEVRGQGDYSTAEVWLFRSADDAFDHWARLTAGGYAQWFTSANSLGARRKGDA